jgi:hypothetical protein
MSWSSGKSLAAAQILFDLQIFAQNALIYVHLGFIHGFMFFQQFLLGSEEHPHK